VKLHIPETSEAEGKRRPRVGGKKREKYVIPKSHHGQMSRLPRRLDPSGALVEDRLTFHKVHAHRLSGTHPGSKMSLFQK